MGKADLHIHSSYSYDSTNTVPAILDWTANATELDVIAITDHDCIEGALEARDRASAYGIEVIPGIEITTAEGHLLALFVERAVPPGLSLHESVLRVGDLGGICVAAHPYGFMAHGVTSEVVQDVLRDADAARVLVGAEAMNSGLVVQKSNQRARQLAEDANLALAGGSDSHLFWTIGFGYTSFPGSSAEDLRTALLNRTTEACRLDHRHSPGYYISHLFYMTIRRFGWVTWSPEPNASLVLRRLADVQSAA